MSDAVSSPISQLIRRLAVGMRTEEVPDHELVRRFVSGGDGAPFHALVVRHGPMVLAVYPPLPST